jgi:hypothetical protein
MATRSLNGFEALLLVGKFSSGFFSFLLFFCCIINLFLDFCCSWLLKWPMKSQKFGRRMRRFFVLRDHILSYHVTRPADEEEVYSNYSLSSLHVTENTTVEVGRHMFMRSLVITTPLDTLWIRMQNGSTDENKWIAEINKSIQQLQKSKYAVARNSVHLFPLACFFLFL